MIKRTGGALLLSIEIDRSAVGTVSNQLYTAMRDIIHAGGLHPDERLPASRTLAKDLNISRTTVINVFEILTSEGLVESRTGAGTFVSKAWMATRPTPPPSPEKPSTELANTPMPKPRLSQVMTHALDDFSDRLPHKGRAFTTALPAFDAFPRALWAQHVTRHWRSNQDVSMGYADPRGHFPLRQAIASHLLSNRGIKCEPEQIFIVSGAQQAFQLIGNVLLDPGDKVWFENPGAIGARNSLIASGAKLIPVPVDADGLVVEQGLRQAPRFRLAFVTPSHQQPLGVSMSLERRYALLQAADDANAFIIEDDYDGEFRYSGHPLPTLKSIDSIGRVIYVGTFSKTLFPALRLGFFLSPPPLVEVFDRVSKALLQGVPSSHQAVVADFMQEGHFATHIRRMRKIYAERHQVLCDAANQRLGGMLDIVPTDTGLHTIGRLAPQFSESRVASAALERDIVVTPIERFCIAPSDVKGLVIGFSGIKPAEIISGVNTLGDVLDECKSRG
jgi:GntR family transcriptional regulator/MocR family aminotransferase